MVGSKKEQKDTEKEKGVRQAKIENQMTVTIAAT